MKIIYALYRDRNGGKHVHSDKDLSKKSTSQAVVVLMRVAIICYILRIFSKADLF